MRHLHSLELLLQQKLQQCPASQVHRHKPHQGHTPHAFVWKTVSWFNSHTCHTQHPKHPLGRSTRGRKIMCKALAPQTGDAVPAPRLLWAVMPQAPPLPQQSWCSSSHSPALVENWEQEEAAEKCHCCKKTVSFPARAPRAPTESRKHPPDADSAQTNTSGCAGNAQPRPLGCCFTPRAPRHSPEHHSANLAATWKTSQELQPLGRSSLEIRRVAGSKGFSSALDAPDPSCSGAVIQATTAVLYFLRHQATPAAGSSGVSHGIPGSGAAVRLAGRHSRAEGSTCMAPAQPPLWKLGHVIVS